MATTPPAEPPAETSLLGEWRRVGARLLLLRVAGQGTEFGGFVLLARELGASSFGRVAVAFLICRYAGLVADWGASVRGARDVAASGDTQGLHGLVGLRTRLSLAAAAIYIVVTVATGHAALAPLAMAIVGRGMARDWIALGRHHGARAGVPAIIQGSLLLVGGAIASTEQTASMVIAIAYAAALCASLFLNRLPRGGDANPASLNGWMLGAVLADQVTASTDTILLAAFHTAREAGIYAAMYRIPNAWITLVGLSVVGFVPLTARVLRDRPAAFAELRARALRTGFMAAAVIAATIPIAWLLVPTVFGDGYTAGRTPLVILLVATAVNALAASLHPLYIALQRDRGLAAISMAAAGLNLSANLVMIPLFGMTGAAATTLGAQVLLLILFWVAIQRAAFAHRAEPARHMTPARRITVAMATYNGERFVGAQLQSIIDQHRPPDEIVISDDGSEDDTVAVVRATADRAGVDVRVLQEGTRLGVTGNFERAIAAATGDVIALADQDDVWRADKLARVEAAMADGHAAAVFSDAELIDEASAPSGERLLAQMPFGPTDRRRVAHGETFESLVRGNFVTGATLAFRADLRAVLLPMSLDGFHDVWIALLTSAIGDVPLLDDPLIGYRVHGGNVQGVPARRLATVLAERRRRTDVREHELRQFEAALHRLETAELLTDARRALLAGKVAHLQFRADLPRSRVRRIAPVLSRVVRGDYTRYGRGLRSATYDVLYG
ncbi:MAG TPA: glycosyltransferase [Acidimicrobiales bacterium]|nr:glycosyltransferase [Acidimicrobiales bacterium]